MNNMENKNGAYYLEGVLYHQHSNRLCEAILKIWPDKSIPVIDLGCGMNYYCSVLEYAGYTAYGVDGVLLKGVDESGDITDKNFISYLKGKFAPCNVLSLEVGEHLPPHLSDPYLDNVCSFGGDVLLSWAVPGQAGVGHINNRPNEWVIEEMSKRGYAIDKLTTDALRENVKGCRCSWFVNTLMYFRPCA